MAGPRGRVVALVACAAPLLFCFSAVIAEVLDAEVEVYRARLARALAADDIEQLHELAFETEPIGDVAAEVTALQAVVQGYIETAFVTRRDALTSPKPLLDLADEGEARSVSAAAVAAARTKAREAAQETLDTWLAAGDLGGVADSLTTALRAGCTATSIATAQDQLREAASAELQAALAGDAGELSAAIARAAAYGVAAAELQAATQSRNAQVLQALTAAQASTDLSVKMAALRLAENAGDATLSTQAASLRQSLAALANATLSGAAAAAASDLPRLRAAVAYARDLGLVGEAAFAEAWQLVHQEDKREEARAAMASARAEQDWWAMLGAVQDARSAGVAEADVNAAAAEAAAGARSLLQTVESGGELSMSDVEAAWALGKAAGLPDADLAQASSQLATAAKAELQAATTSGSIADLVALLRGSHLLAADRSSGEAALRSAVDAWLAKSLATNGQEAAGTLAVIELLTPVAEVLTSGQLGQAIGRFQAQLFAELRAAADAASLARLDVVFQAVAGGGAYLKFDSPDGEPDDSPAAAGARAKLEELGRLLERAGTLRGQLRLRADAVATLTETLQRVGLSDLRAALDAATAANCSDAELAPFNTEYQARHAEVDAATSALYRSIRVADYETLLADIRRGEQAGLDEEQPRAMELARSRLATLEAELEAATTEAPTEPPTTASTTPAPSGTTLPELSFIDPTVGGA